jgi:hypothetical protein
MITNIFFLSALIVSGGLTASTAEQSILLEQDCDVALSGSDILKTVPVDFAVQYRAWLHALIVQKGALCKSQRNELQQFCRSVQRSSLPLATQRELVVSLKQLVKHTRRNWIVGLSLVSGVLATVGILWALKKSQFKSIDSGRKPDPINDDDIMNGSALGSGMLTESGASTPVGSVVESPSTPPRPELKVLGPPGGSPGMALASQGNSKAYTPDHLSQWKQNLEQRETDKQREFLLERCFEMLIAAFEQNILSEELYNVILELCINHTKDDAEERLKTNEATQATVKALMTQYQNSDFGAVLLEYINFLIPEVSVE